MSFKLAFGLILFMIVVLANCCILFLGRTDDGCPDAQELPNVNLISILGRQIINLSFVKKKERPTKNKRQTNKGYVILETHTKIFSRFI